MKQNESPPMPFQNFVARRFPLPDTGWVEVRSDNGPIRVEGWSRAEVAFELRIGADEAVKLRQVVPEFATTAGSVRLTVRENYAGVSYDYRRDGPKVTFHPARTVVTLRLPRTAALKMASSNGDFEIREMRGEVEATTYNGRLLYVLSRGTAQQIRAKTFNGTLVVPEPPFRRAAGGTTPRRQAEARLGAGTHRVILDSHNGRVEVR